jgi:hypothetical protein
MYVVCVFPDGRIVLGVFDKLVFPMNLVNNDNTIVLSQNHQENELMEIQGEKQFPISGVTKRVPNSYYKVTISSNLAS